MDGLQVVAAKKFNRDDGKDLFKCYIFIATTNNLFQAAYASVHEDSEFFAVGILYNDNGSGNYYHSSSGPYFVIVRYHSNFICKLLTVLI